MKLFRCGGLRVALLRISIALLGTDLLLVVWGLSPGLIWGRLSIRTGRRSSGAPSSQVLTALRGNETRRVYGRAERGRQRLGQLLVAVLSYWWLSSNGAWGQHRSSWLTAGCRVGRDGGSRVQEGVKDVHQRPALTFLQTGKAFVLSSLAVLVVSAADKRVPSCGQRHELPNAKRVWSSD